MDWTKIKTKHYLYSDMSLAEHGALSRLLCLTAHLEALPTLQQMLKLVPQRCLNTLSDKLRTPLPRVLERVLEDVEGIYHRREVSRETSRKHRDRDKSDKSPSLSNDTIEKKEKKEKKDKKDIREEVESFSDLLFNKWNTFTERYFQLSRVRSITPQRKKHLKERFGNKDFRDSFDKVLLAIPKSKFLMGKNDREWVVDFDFLIKNDENYHKILEGKYEDDKTKNPALKRLEESGLL